MEDLISIFEMAEGTTKLELLMEYGRGLPALAAPYRNWRDAGQHMVWECQAPVFFYVEIQEGQLFIYADVPKEAALARGFAGVLYETFHQQPLAILQEAPDDLLASLGLRPLLGLQRQRGLGAIWQRLKNSLPRP